MGRTAIHRVFAALLVSALGLAGVAVLLVGAVMVGWVDVTPTLRAAALTLPRVAMVLVIVAAMVRFGPWGLRR